MRNDEGGLLLFGSVLGNPKVNGLNNPNTCAGDK